ncbi:MAG: hypothetical protein GC149_20460 [Gammaproteobacteria bacterium]|nr:hypothetical protein [Gammaproteobacteria bacterium]
MFNSFSDVIISFGTTAKFAEEIDVPYPTAAAWKRRNSIPSKFWNSVISSAKRCGIKGITHEKLAQMASQEGGES